MPYSKPSVLSIAGSDSSGGAGIQADIKSISALGGFAQTAITALTAQNTCGVNAIYGVPADFMAAQIDAVFQDIRPDAVKIGMLSSPEAIATIAERLVHWQAQHVVVDPVMVATSGASLSSDSTVAAMVEHLFPLAELVTPNLDEGRVLAGMDIASKQDMLTAAQRILELVPRGAVLLKGGHSADDADDLLYTAEGPIWMEGPRVATSNTHGTGCTLSSSIATGLAYGKPLQQAVADAKAYITGALAAGFEMGKGSGPLDHMYQHR